MIWLKSGMSVCRRIGVRSVVTHVRGRAAEAKARDAFLVPDKLKKGSVLRGVPVTSVDWSGFGIAKIWVRGDKQETEYQVYKALPGEKLDFTVTKLKQWVVS